MGKLSVAALAALFVIACKQGEKKETAGSAVGSAAETKPGETKPGETKPGEAKPAATGSAAVVGEELRPLEAPPPAKLLDKPVERRLYSDRIESSSFLWTDWNKFQENYHANYVMDGDPTTAWVEGADKNGVGEWVRIHVSPVEGATKIRLKIQNGYHKSKELHKKNARLKKVELVALPGGTKQSVELKDAMGWQEVAFEQPAGKLEAIELRAVEVFDGSKYTDLCVSDVEVYVTGLTAENPAFEKSKLDSLLAWKKKRLDAAKLLGGASAKELPILAGYRVTHGEKVSFQVPEDKKPHAKLRAALAALGKHASAAPAYADVAKRATAALESKFGGWVSVQAVAKKPLEVPEVDGLRAPIEGEETMFGLPEDAFLWPESDQGVLLRSTGLTTFDTKGGHNPIDDDKCKPGKSQFLRPPRKAEDGPVVRELLHVRCVAEETRDGKITFAIWQVLEFDADGNLVLVAGPDDLVQWLEWQKRETGSVLVGGGRLTYEGATLDKLGPAPTVAKK